MRVPHEKCQVCHSWGPCLWSMDPIRRLCVKCHEEIVGPVPA